MKVIGSFSCAVWVECPACQYMFDLIDQGYNEEARIEMQTDVINVVTGLCSGITTQCPQCDQDIDCDVSY